MTMGQAEDMCNAHNAIYDKLCEASQENDKLQAENKKLTAQIDEMHKAGLGPDYTDIVYRELKAENAKLREVLRDLLPVFNQPATHHGGFTCIFGAVYLRVYKQKIEQALKAATTGNQKDLQEYLKLRKQ
jgi:cell division protein FtsB